MPDHITVECLRERGSGLYLGMATEILNLPLLCITRIMAKEATNPKPSMQRECYCLARGNAITQPRSHPIPKFYIFLMGWDRGWVMAFPLFLCFFEGWNMTGHP